MKSDRQLNQPLQVQPEPPTRRRVARQSAPHVLQSLMGFEKMTAIEEVNPQAEALVTQSRDQSRILSIDCVTLPTRIVTSHPDCVGDPDFYVFPYINR